MGDTDDLLIGVFFFVVRKRRKDLLEGPWKGMKHR